VFWKGREGEKRSNVRSKLNAANKAKISFQKSAILRKKRKENPDTEEKVGRGKKRRETP